MTAARGDAFRYTNITTNTTTVVKTGLGALMGIHYNTPAGSGTVTVYDNTAGSGTKIATITKTTTGLVPLYVQFKTGLTVVTSAADDITVMWS